MIGVIVVGHGNIASDMVAVAEQILHGKQEYFEAVNVKMGESEETIRNNLHKIVKMAEIDGALVLSDLSGGSLSTTCAYFGRNTRNVAVVTGVNLPMVLKVLTHRKDVRLKELVSLACEGGKAGILDVCGQTKEQDEG